MTKAMPVPLITAEGMRVPVAPAQAARVALDGDAVLPIARFRRGSFVPWPGGLAPRVAALGPTQVAVLDGEGAVLSSVVHDFGGTLRWHRPTDPRGRRLTLDKWGWWVLPLGDRDAAELDLALRDTRAVLDELAGRGLPAWIAGGTLLGAVRAGGFIPHDDDVDIAYLAGSSIPDEVARESFELERHLGSRGWESRRFSAAHFQLTRTDRNARSPIHVDVFSAFFRDGRINQPFHVRGPFRAEDLLPLAEVSLAGTALPAPRDVDAWLTLNYGPGWRSPDPEHSLATPGHVTRLFGGWFGHYQAHYEYWQDLATRGSGPRPEPSESARWLARVLPAGTTIIELGAGDAVDAQFLADRGLPTLATDLLAPRGPFELPGAGMSLVRANASDPRDLMRLALSARRSGRSVHVHSRHLVEWLDPSARRIMLRALRHLPDDASVSMTTHLAARGLRHAGAPAVSGLSWRSIHRDSPVGMSWAPMLVESQPGAGGTLLWGERTGMGQGTRLARLRALPRTLGEVRTELGELRRVPLRLAEIEDVVVERLAAIEDAVPELDDPRDRAEADGGQVDGRSR